VSDGDTLVASALRDSQSGTWSGAVHVYGRSAAGWSYTTTVRSSPPVPYAEFGVSVALEGDRLVVGALGEQSNSGAVYVFERVGGTWSQTARLVASDSSAEALFGYSVDLEGDRVVVGSIADAAYVFEHTPGGWIQSQRITGGNGRFGQTVSLDGEELAVGAYLQTDFGSASGAAFVFRHGPSGFVQEAVLHASDAGSGQEFGNWVSLRNGVLAVCAPYADFPDQGAGALHVFERAGTTWTHVARLAPADLALGDRFGYAATDGSRIVAAARSQDSAGADAGSAYLFERVGGTWTQRGKFTAPGGSSGDLFGYSCSLRDSTVLLGSALSDLHGPDRGAVFAFDLAQTACWANCGGSALFDGLEIDANPSLDANGNDILDTCECTAWTYCVGAPNSVGAGARIDYAGTTSIGGNDLTLLCRNLPPSTSGVFFYGPGSTQVPFGNGYRCVSGSIRRTGIVVVSATGNASRALNQTALPGGDTLVAGDVRYFQFWYRNTAAGGAGFNLSDALAVSFCP
jgi:hypothetical protein